MSGILLPLALLALVSNGVCVVPAVIGLVNSEIPKMIKCTNVYCISHRRSHQVLCLRFQ